MIAQRVIIPERWSLSSWLALQSVSGTELRPMTRAYLIKTHPCFHPMPCRTRARTIEINFISSGSCRCTSCQYPPGTSGNYFRQGFKNFIRTFRFVCLEGKVGKTKKAFALTTYTIVLISFFKKNTRKDIMTVEKKKLWKGIIICDIIPRCSLTQA